MKEIPSSKKVDAAIIQVGENLRGKSFEEWKTLSEKEDPLVITRYDDTPLSKALFFSYMMLPQLLKPFFMYMGVFPKHYGISRSKLIKLWVSEGFLGTDPGIEEITGNALDLCQFVLDALALRFYEFPHQLLALVHLTHLSITCDRELPNSISTLSNLEVLIFIRYHNIKFSNNGPVCLPIDIWNMHKLRQLYCEGFDLPPPLDNSHLENLLTISGVSAHSCITEVLSRIPNLNRIAVQIESAHDSTETFNFFGHFASVYEEFESFKCVVVNPNLSSQIVRSVPNIPMNIRKISLSGCGLPWENMQVIASLPNLRVLKLRWYAFCGPLWKTSTGQFPSLEFLLLEDLDIENLELDIPYLRWVIVRHCYKLENISNQFKNTGLLEVDDCNPSFMKKMRECRPFLGAEAKVGSSSTDL
ncbi:PREDICTED: putative late blight resistance protein homolog R1A-10 [Erythranthe guttata]|uniref:putative late blight resistance protein homolog R1A-10 n=1 Tax=Erythranthe guttata TaxID=4155 RepID=UPI00064D7CE6|nr:PREDICTED: putative late blight resistance protein homolog R1A-10 [Erythranthe guttata]|eukprot:XP_012843173.1 PREDICTED: putative late blight resistance protein homolog R1A-10 [Erythranthe guttata]